MSENDYLNRVFLGNNLEIMKDIPDESIDLIYIDPPFYSQDDYGDFNDKWDDMDDYLDFMRVRLKEIHRILKDTGSFYLHCDYHASHYLKIELDNIFGYDNFRNEIIWYYPNKSHSRYTLNIHTRSHNTIFFYTKSNEYIYNQIREKIKEDSHNFPYKDSEGRRYRIVKDRKIYKGNGYRNSHDVWEINFINPNSPEREDYATQKPEKLLERIIRASSNEGDIVADFFCGSGTTLAVAKKTHRNYMGCDINKDAVELTQKRLEEIKVYKNINQYLSPKDNNKNGTKKINRWF